MIRLSNKQGQTPFMSEEPDRKELERMSVPQLLVIATHKRYNRNPFKKTLVDYILSLGKLGI